MHRLVIAMVLVLLCLTVGGASRAETVRCQPNIFGGQDCDTPDGRIQSQPNIFGGQDYTLPDGSRVRSQPNIFGGQDYRGEHGRPVPPILPLLGERPEPKDPGK